LKQAKEVKQAEDTQKKLKAAIDKRKTDIEDLRKKRDEQKDDRKAFQELEAQIQKLEKADPSQ